MDGLTDARAIELFRSLVPLPGREGDVAAHLRRVMAIRGIVAEQGGLPADRAAALFHNAGRIFDVTPAREALGAGIDDILALPCPFTDGPDDFAEGMSGFPGLRPRAKAVALAGIIAGIRERSGDTADPGAPEIFARCLEIVEACRHMHGIQPMIRMARRAATEALLRTSVRADGY